MKIVIEIEDAAKYSLAPNYVYLALKNEYHERQSKKYGMFFARLVTACDEIARAFYAQQTGRHENVKSLILTYADAEKCFEIFKKFADVWIAQIVGAEMK